MTNEPRGRRWPLFLFLIPLLLLCIGCSAVPAPRVTTAEERAQANQTLTLIETGVTAAVLAGKLKPEDLAKAQQAIAVLRTLVAQSETEPIGIGDLMLRIANLAALWVPPPGG